MQTYDYFRAFADSWFLIAMVAFFLGTWVFAFWPSLKPARDDAASIPFRDDPVSVANKGAHTTDLEKGADNG